MRWSGRQRDLADAYWILLCGIAVGLIVGILIVNL